MSKPAFITTIKPVCQEIQSQQPQLSETMAIACALLAMAEFRQKILDAQKSNRIKTLG